MVYQRAARRLGWLGRPLRGDFARAALGYVGLLLLIAALLWLLRDGLRWTG